MEGEQNNAGSNDVDDVVSKTQNLSLRATNGDGAHSPSFKLNPTATEFVPRFGPAATSAYNPDWVPPSSAAANFDDATSEIIDGYDMVMSELKEVIDSISAQPACYDTYIDHITDILNSCVDEEEDIILECAVNTVMDQAIVDQNFRYNGARMCQHFVINLHIGTEGRKFKQILLQRCQREISRRESLAKASDGGNYLRGLTLFVGDLATKFNEREINDAMPDLINTLLNKPFFENVKTVCNVLKLCGQSLDAYHKAAGSNSIDRIFERMKQLSENDSNARIENILTNIVEFKERGWASAPLPANFYNPYAQQNNQSNIDAPIPPQTGQGDVKVRRGAFLDIWYPPGVVPPANPPPQQHYNPPPQQHRGPPAGNQHQQNSSYDFGACGDEQDTDVCDAFEEFLKASGQMN